MPPLHSAQPATGPNMRPPVVQVKAGKLRGFTEDKTFTFRGIPYADAERFELAKRVRRYRGQLIGQGFSVALLGAILVSGVIHVLTRKHVSSDWVSAFASSIPFLVPALQVVTGLRRVPRMAADLRDGKLICGPGSGTARLSRSGTPWVENGLPAAWRLSPFYHSLPTAATSWLPRAWRNSRGDLIEGRTKRG